MRLRLQKRYKHFRRYRKIANILVKHGFGYLLDSLGLAEFVPSGRFLSRDESKVPEEPRAVRLRLVLTELGPTFIKLGQVLSTRSDIIAPDYIKELEKLQDQVPPAPFHEIKERLELELGQPVSEIFYHIDPEPLAAASIGQVHRGQLPGGENVVIKVQRQGIRETMETDIEILYDLAGLAQRHTAWGKLYNFTEMVEEFEHVLHQELDFVLEGRHAQTLGRNSSEERFVIIPKVYWDYTTKRVLTLEYLDGVKLNDKEEIVALGHDPVDISRKLTEAILKQVLIDGFFHADPHPGNLLALPAGRIAFLDFGIMGHLEQDLRDKIAGLVLGLINKDSREIMRAITNLGVLPANISMHLLRRDIERLREKYYEIPLKKITASESLGDIMNVAYRHRIKVPTEFTLLIKTLVLTEGIAARLNPEISIVEIVEPLGKELLRRRFNIKSIRKIFWDNINDYHVLFKRLPNQLNQIIELIDKGEIKVKTENPDLKLVLMRLNTMVNRLVYSIIVGSMVVSSSWLITERVKFWGIPLAEIGYITAGVLGLWLLILIIRSRFL